MASTDRRTRLLNSRPATSPWTIPIAVVVLILVLGVLKISGSSVALQSETDPSAQALGTPRPARIDEYNSRTALVIRQSKTDFTAVSALGVGTHDTGVLTDLPVKDLSAVLKPPTWPYFVLDVERAFAIEWWLTMLGPFLGVYALMMVLTRSRIIAALTGLLVA